MTITLTAILSGNTDVATNWEEVGTLINRAPTASDTCDLNGLEMTQAGGALTLAGLVDGWTGGKLVITDNFTCASVVDASLFVGSDLSTKKIDAGIIVTTAIDAIRIANGGILGELAGTISNSGNGVGIYNAGTIADLSCTLTNSGTWYGIRNVGTIADLSCTLTNSGTQYGISNAGTVVDISGVIIYSSGAGIINYGTLPSLDDMTGTICNKSKQPDLVDGNISVGKSILGVVGTMKTGQGIGGAGILGML